MRAQLVGGGWVTLAVKGAHLAALTTPPRQGDAAVVEEIFFDSMPRDHVQVRRPSNHPSPLWILEPYSMRKESSVWCCDGS